LSDKILSENNLNKIFYYEGSQFVNDILNYQLVKSRKVELTLKKFLSFYKNKSVPEMPVGAEYLMKKFNIPEGKKLGVKLKEIEEEWVNNNFQISEKQIDHIANS